MYRMTIAQRDRCLTKEVKSSFCLHLPANVPMEKEDAYLSTNVNCLRIFCLRTEDSCRRRRACLRTIVCQCGLGFIIDYDYASMKRRFVDSKTTDILGGKEPCHIFCFSCRMRGRAEEERILQRFLEEVASLFAGEPIAQVRR